MLPTSALPVAILDADIADQSGSCARQELRATLSAGRRRGRSCRARQPRQDRPARSLAQNAAALYSKSCSSGLVHAAARRSALRYSVGEDAMEFRPDWVMSTSAHCKTEKRFTKLRQIAQQQTNALLPLNHLGRCYRVDLQVQILRADGQIPAAHPSATFWL